MKMYKYTVENIAYMVFFKSEAILHYFRYHVKFYFKYVGWSYPIGNFRTIIVKSAHIRPTYFKMWYHLEKILTFSREVLFIENVKNVSKWKVHQNVKKSFQIILNLLWLHLP